MGERETRRPRYNKPRGSSRFRGEGAARLVGQRAARDADEALALVAYLYGPDGHLATLVDGRGFGRDSPAGDGAQVVGIDLDADRSVAAEVCVEGRADGGGRLGEHDRDAAVQQSCVLVMPLVNLHGE